jgi:predicted nuclease of restriction endonuclease-like (RecB) superfamily
MSKQKSKIATDANLLYRELSELIEQSKRQLVSVVNNTLTMLFWHIGGKINAHILQHKRAEYGKQIVATLSRQLTSAYGNSFEEKNLRRMMQFAEQFSDIEIVVTLSRQLSWSHFLVLLPIKNWKAKIFYAEMSAKEMWSVRELRKQIENKIYERKSLANIQLRQDNNTSDAVFKDPYFLDFLNLREGYLENDLESAILKELESFILELGYGFTFVARQKRLIIDNEDFYLDLLFFHRKLRRLVAIELKLGKFQAKYKGQMELYLKWLDRYEKQENENTPIGLILCAETSREQIELLEMHKDGIMVAEYWTELPPKKELEKRLHKALIQAKERLERGKLLK